MFENLESSSLNIGIHTGGIQEAEQTGVGGHTLALLEQFKRFKDKLSFHIINDVPDSFQIPESFTYHSSNFTNRPYRIYQDLLGSGLKARLENLDLLHCPKTTAPVGFNETVTITVHDIIFKKFPESYSTLWRQYWNLVLSISLNQADEIISVSSSTKKDLINLMNVSPQKITVIPNGIGFEHYQRKVVEKDRLHSTYQIPDNYLLSIGNFFPRKNLQRLLEVFHRLKQDHSNLNLVMAGPGGEGENSLRRKVKKLNLEESVYFPGYITYDHLPGLYYHAIGLVYPSLDEGFGMPLLESFATGTPVACSDRDVFREIGGDLPLYFDPKNINDMKDTMTQMIEHQTIDLDQAHSVAKSHDWNAIGDQYFEFFKSFS